MSLSTFNHSIHVHADDETCALNGFEEDGSFVIFTRDGREKIFINLDESLRVQLINILMTREERQESPWRVG